MDIYYCPNVKCAYGIGLAEVFKSAEQCPKCGNQTRKFSFIDMIKLVEDKKKYQSNPEPVIEEPPAQDEPNHRLLEILNQIRPFREKVAESIQEPVIQEPVQESIAENTLEPVPETGPETVQGQNNPVLVASSSIKISLAEMSDEDIRKDIDSTLENLGREEYVRKASEESDHELDNDDGLISDGIRVLIEQKNIMIKQNELILRSLQKLQQN